MVHDRLKLLIFALVLCEMPLLSMEALYMVEDVNLILCKGDITEQPVDAIVNAANDHMLGGSGVDGAIHHAAGQDLLEYNKTQIPMNDQGDRCPLGQVRVTPSFKLAQVGIKYIIHTNGPRGTTPCRELFLEQCYHNAIVAANNFPVSQDGIIQSLACPAISVGIFGYPLQEATDIAVRTILDTLRELKSLGRLNLRQIRIVLYDKDPHVNELVKVYKKTCEHYLLGMPKLLSERPMRQGLFKSFARYISLVARQSAVQLLRPLFCGFKHVGAKARAIIAWF